MIEKRPGAFAPGRFGTGRIASGQFSALVVTVKSWRPYSSVAVIRILGGRRYGRVFEHVVGAVFVEEAERGDVVAAGVVDRDVIVVVLPDRLQLRGGNRGSVFAAFDFHVGCQSQTLRRTTGLPSAFFSPEL